MVAPHGFLSYLAVLGPQRIVFLTRGKSESKNLFVAKESHEKCPPWPQGVNFFNCEISEVQRVAFLIKLELRDPAAIADLRKEFDYLKWALTAFNESPLEILRFLRVQWPTRLLHVVAFFCQWSQACNTPIFRRQCNSTWIMGLDSWRPQKEWEAATIRFVLQDMM